MLKVAGMVKTTQIVERVKKLGAAKFGPRFTDQFEWARAAGVSIPTLRDFLKGVDIKLTTIAKIVAPLGYTVDLVIRKNGKGKA